MNKSLITILITVFLDVLWLWLVIPIMPFLVKSYWVSEFYVWLAFSVFSIWMFIWWLIFWKLSDKYWRKKILCLTILLNLIWYLIFANSANIIVFLIARFIWWIWGSGFSIWQAFISDVSTEENRTKNMWMMWAMFWIWFILWPVIWTIFSWNNLNFIWYISAFIILLNLILVIFIMKEPDHHKLREANNIKIKLKIEKKIGVLFIASLVTAMWFSAMQSTFPVFLSDVFWQKEKTVWLFFWYIWLISLCYQWYFIRITGNYLNEKSMILFWLLCLSIWFIGFSLNSFFYFIFIFITLFPIGYWSINPAIASLQAKMSPNHTWQILWINTSFVSMWNIF